MRLSPRTPLLSAGLAVSLLVVTASAAGPTNLPNLSAAAASASAAAANTGKPSNTGSASSAAEPTDARTGASKQSSSVVITGSGSTDSATGAIPTITGGSAATDNGALPHGLPTLSGAFRIVAPSVPPTSNAPYMRISNLPEGTVFIAVGAILGFLAMSVLLWRGLIAWSLHRSVKRAAMIQNMSDTKALFRTPAAPFYKYSDRDSSVSLTGHGHKGGKRGGRPRTAPGAASTSSLFFSPTAGAAGSGLAAVGNRGSNYLPAGYYAAGAAQPGNGQGQMHLGSGHSHGISLTNLAPQSQGYSRASVGPSPPDSPAFAPSGHAAMASSSTLNLHQSYGGEQRAPSAYLEDLIDGEGAPPVRGHASSQSREKF